MDTTDNPQGIGLNAAQDKIAALLDPEDFGQPGEDGDDGVETPDDPEDGDDPELLGEDGEEGDQDEPEEPDEDEEEPRYTVKVDGEEIEVTLDELVNGYQKDSDYRRKTQKLAEERQALDADREIVTSAKAEREQYATLLPKLRKMIEAAPDEPDWEKLIDDDPQEYLKAKHKWEAGLKARAAQIEAMDAEEKRVKEASDREATANAARYAKEQESKLLELVKPWKDQKVREREAKQIRDWALNQGFSKEEIGAIGNARLAATFRKAWLFDQGKQRADAGRKPAPVTLKPGESTPPANRKPTKEISRQRQRLAHTGRVSDAASLIEKML